MAWYNDSWTYRLKLTVNNGEVDADLTNFPVYVNLANLPAGFHTNVKSDGGDIRVTTSDGTTEVPREVVVYDAGTDTGELHFKSPSLANASDTEFYIYYGNASASNHANNATYGAQNVWTNSYAAVYHMQETVNNSASGYLDSTSNLRHGTGTSMSIAASAGQLGGKAQNFDGTADYIRVTNSIGADFTVQAWINSSQTFPSTTDTYNGTGILWSDVGGGANDLIVGGTRTGTLDRLSFFTGNPDNTLSGTVEITTGSWVNITVTRLQSTGAKILYTNGTADTNSTGGTGTLTANPNIDIGGNTGDSRYFSGAIDEVRLSTTVRTATWLSTEYSNQSAPTSFYTVGAQEPVVPDAPTSLDAVAGAKAVTLTWTIPSNGGAPISYKIYRDTSTNPTTLIASIADGPQYFDSGLSAGTTYYYRVKASNRIGDSAYSTEDSATPLLRTTSTRTLATRTAAGARTLASRSAV